MNKLAKFAAGIAALSVLVLPFSVTQADLQTDAKGFATLQLGEETWKEYPGIPGINVMSVYGDLSKAGVYVIRVRFSPGTMSMPHFHGEDRLATVLKGTWWTGTESDFNPARTQPIRAGGYMMHPAGESHFDGAKDEEVVLQIVGVGPSTTMFVRPELGRTGSSR